MKQRGPGAVVVAPTKPLLAELRWATSDCKSVWLIQPRFQSVFCIWFVCEKLLKKHKSFFCLKHPQVLAGHSTPTFKWPISTNLPPIFHQSSTNLPPIFHQSSTNLPPIFRSPSHKSGAASRNPRAERILIRSSTSWRRDQQSAAWEPRFKYDSTNWDQTHLDSFKKRFEK